MTRFYDTINPVEQERVERILSKGGIAYSLQLKSGESVLREINVAEEDVTYAETLLCRALQPRTRAGLRT